MGADICEPGAGLAPQSTCHLTSSITCLASCGREEAVSKGSWRGQDEEREARQVGPHLRRGSHPHSASCGSKVWPLPGSPGPCGLLPAPSTISAFCRVSFLKKAVDQRNKALTSLNEAMNVSCALLSSREGPRPISCTTTTSWSHLPLQDVLTATCLLQNSGDFSLDRGWTLCIQVLTSSSALDLDAAGSAVTYTIPVDRLGPGSQREVTLPLGPTESGVLDLPVTVSCALFYSLREVVGGALAPSGPLEDPFLEEHALGLLPEQEGICLPLSRLTVDMLRCLRFPGLASPHAQAPCLLSPARDPVDTFLETCCVPSSEPAGPASLRAKYLPPSVASIRVSAELLRTALEDARSGWWHRLASLWPRGPEACGVGCLSLSPPRFAAPRSWPVLHCAAAPALLC